MTDMYVTDMYVTAMYELKAVQHSITLDPTLTGLTHTRDRYAKKMLESLVSPQLSKPGKPWKWTLSRKELTDLSQRYGEQWVDDPCEDLDQFFNITNNRCPRGCCRHVRFSISYSALEKTVIKQTKVRYARAVRESQATSWKNSSTRHSSDH